MIESFEGLTGTCTECILGLCTKHCQFDNHLLNKPLLCLWSQHLACNIKNEVKITGCQAHCSKSSFFVPRKLSNFFGVKNSWKCCGFGLFSCGQLWFHEKNCQKNWAKNSWKCWGFVKIEVLDKNLTFRIVCLRCCCYAATEFWLLSLKSKLGRGKRALFGNKRCLFCEWEKQAFKLQFYFLKSEHQIIKCSCRVCCILK